MSYWEHNYNLIRQNKEFMHSKLKDYTFDTNELEELSLLDTREEIQTIKVIRAGKTYRLNSAYAPIREAKKWASQYEYDKLNMVTTLFGLGNGLIALELLKKMKTDDLLFIYEPSPMIFQFVMENYDLSLLLNDSRVSITVKGINDYEYENLLMGYVSWINVRSQIICNHMEYDMIFPDEFSWLIKRIHDNNDRAVTNKNTENALGKTFVNNALSNIKYINQSNIITDFIGKIPQDVPAIIVAAGPSLDKNIEDLKLAKGKAFIIAVDTAMKYLNKYNIEPDIVVTIDPNKFPGHFCDTDKVPIFCKLESNPAILDNYKGRKIFFNLEGYTKELYEKLGKDSGNLNTGGSVATGAFAICVEFGFNYIIMIGQDLAYSNGATHAGGVKVDVSNCGSAQETVEDIYGNSITTRHDWYEYLTWFNDAVEFYKSGEVIDATEGGAKIKNTKIMTLKDAISKYCKKEFDFKELFEKEPYTLNDDDVIKLKEIIQQGNKEFNEMKELINKGIEVCNRLIKEYTHISSESYTSKQLVEKLNRINGKIEEYSTYLLVDSYCSGILLINMADIYQCRDDVQSDKITIYTKTKEIYEEFLKAIDEIMPKLSVLG